MAAVNPPKYSKSEVSQKFNLKTLLGYEPSEKQKKLFYELAVAKMANRTMDGEDINGENFEPYSENYADAKGVTVNSVDLVLNGDMLSSFQQSLERKNIVKIKIKEGKQTLKAFNHCTGDTLPTRNFFGFKSKEDLNDVISEVDSFKERRVEEEKIDLATLREALKLITVKAEGFNGED